MFARKGPKFNADKCKVQLKMLGARFKLLLQKKTNLAKQQKREVALLLRADKEANARILVEHIIREDYTLESYELLRQHGDLILARFNVIVVEQELKPEVAEAVASLLYGGYLLGGDVPELKVLMQLFAAKYGAAFANEVIANSDKYLNQRLVRMLTAMQVPDPSVVELYLTEIARAYNVQWAPNLTSSSTSTPISATLGVPLPLPGMPTAAAEEPAQLAPAEIFSGEVLPADEVVLAHATGIPLVQAGQVQGDFLAQTVPEGHFAFSIDLRKDRVGGLGITLDVDGSNRVIGLTKGSEAERSGLLRQRDQIVGVNGRQVEDTEALQSALREVAEGARASLSVLREERAEERADDKSPKQGAQTRATPPVQEPPVQEPPVQQPLVQEPPVQELPSEESHLGELPVGEPLENLPHYPSMPQLLTTAAETNLEDDLLAKRLAALKQF